MPNVKGAIRKTKSQLALSGSLAHDPKRYANRRNTAKPTKPLGNPPKHFTKERKALWKEIASNCPPDVLFSSDRYVLEQVCELLEKSRAGTIRAMERTTLLSALQQLGMTPLTRERIPVPEQPELDDDWAALIMPAPKTIEAVCTPNDVHSESK